MTPLHGGSREERLAALFRMYGKACGEPQGSPEFMPRLWARIEARQKSTSIFRRFTGSLATAAAGVSLIVFLTAAPAPLNESFYTSTYLEVLAVDQAAQSPGYAEPVAVERDSEAELLDELL